MPDKSTKTKAEQREATMQKLIEVGRDLFTQYGYVQTPTEEIVEQAGMTRGALYHHFGSKEGLLAAVLEIIQKEVAKAVEAAAGESDDLWEQLVQGCRAFLTACLDPQVQRILLVDAPAVLGWQKWRELDTVNSMALLQGLLAELVEEGLLQPIPVEALTHLLSGAMNEAALWIAQAADQEQTLAEATQALDQLLLGLRVK
jgi:AcrR family transcriptional regulator